MASDKRAPAARAPLIRLHDRRPVPPGLARGAVPRPPTELIEAAERGGVRTCEGSAGMVEAVGIGSFRTPIIGRPQVGEFLRSRVIQLLMSSSSATSSGDRDSPAPATFSRRYPIFDVPGMSKMFGERCNS